MKDKKKILIISAIIILAVIILAIIIRNNKQNSSTIAKQTISDFSQFFFQCPPLLQVHICTSAAASA